MFGKNAVKVLNHFLLIVIEIWNSCQNINTSELDRKSVPTPTCFRAVSKPTGATTGLISINKHTINGMNEWMNKLILNIWMNE